MQNNRYIKKNSIHNMIEHIIIIGLLGTIVLPMFNLGIGISLVTPCSLLLILLLPILIYKEHMVLNRFIFFYMLILLTLYYSIVHSYIVLGVPSTYRDYLELFRYFQILPYFLIISIINYESFEKKVKIYVEVTLVFVLVVSFLEFTNVGGLAKTIGSMYASSGQTDAMISGSNRLVVTAGNPNDGAVVTIFFLIYAIHTYALRKSIYGVVKIMLLFGILLMTQSRTALAGVILSYFIYILLFSKINIFVKILSISFLAFVIISVIVALDLQYIILGFQMAMEGENTSVNVRFENMYLGYERFLQSPYFGWGPAKSIHSTVIDSEYVLIMQRYGSIGLMIFLLYLGVVLAFSRKLIKKYNHKYKEPAILFVFTTVALFIMLTNSLFSGYQTNTIMVFLIVINGSLYRYKKQNAKNIILRRVG